MLDSRKRVIALNYGAAVTSADTIHNTSTGTRIDPTIANGDFKCLNGGIGAKVTWQNTDDITAEVALESYVEANDTTGAALETAPDWADVYKTCGLAETVDTSTVGQEFITYTPSGTQPSSLSECAVWVDGRRRDLSGIVANLVIDGTVGEPIKQTANVMGFTSLNSTPEANPAGTCTASDALIVMKSTDTFTIDGVSKKMQSFKFDLGNQNEKFYALSTKEYERQDFDATIEATFYNDDDAIYASIGDTVPVSLKAGATAGKLISIVAAQAVITDIKSGSDKDKETLTVTLSLQPSNGTAYDHFAITQGYVA